METSWCKRYLIDFWLLVFIGFMLWYRNRAYDRVVSVFLVMVAIVDLLEYGAFSGMDSFESGRWIYITLWVQVLALAIATYIYVQEILACVYMIVMAVVASIFIIYGLFCKDRFVVNSCGWFNDGSSLFLGHYWWVYILGLVIPVILIAYYKNTSVVVLLLYGLLAAIYVSCSSNEENWASNWFLLASGIAFICWIIAPLYSDNCKGNVFI